MSWTWRFEDSDGNSVEAQHTEFANQGDAESWLGEQWRELAESGAANAMLYEDDRLEYKMSLAPADG